MKAKYKIAIAQLNPTVGDFYGNSKKIIAWIKRAEKQKADFIVFPELALCGYPVWDLANKKRFIDEGLRALEKIVNATKKIKVTVFLGFVEPSEKGHARSYNSMAWIERGKVRGIQRKRLLPTYDVFLENIFYKPGNASHVMNSKGLRVGPTICEDIWDDDYVVKPVEQLKKKKAQFIVNISSSPYYKGVAHKRTVVLKKHAIRHKIPILYVNQVGGQDDLIFDGRSALVDSNGKVLFQAPAFEEGLFFYDWNSKAKNSECHLMKDTSADPKEIYSALVLGVKDYCRKNNFKKVLLGLSGGIDSALTAAIATDALGPKAVMGITMPSEYSSKGSWKDSEDLARRLGIECYVQPISKKFNFLMAEYTKHRKARGLKPAPAKKVTLAMENLQARLRGLELMYLSNDEYRLLLTTGNKSELAVGYCTLYGDMAGGLAVLGDVYKTDVFKLCWYRNELSEVIPRSILEKPPSAELRPDQKDEDSLPPYEVLDEILYLYIEQNKSRDEIAEEMKSHHVPRKVVTEIIRKVDHNEYKRRQTPPILRVTEKAWFGRRMPITNRFES